MICHVTFANELRLLTRRVVLHTVYAMSAAATTTESDVVRDSRLAKTVENVYLSSKRQLPRHKITRTVVNLFGSMDCRSHPQLKGKDWICFVVRDLRTLNVQLEQGNILHLQVQARSSVNVVTFQLENLPQDERTVTLDALEDQPQFLVYGTGERAMLERSDVATFFICKPKPGAQFDVMPFQLENLPQNEKTVILNALEDQPEFLVYRTEQRGVLERSDSEKFFETLKTATPYFDEYAMVAVCTVLS
jgi:hypothetical protein